MLLTVFNRPELTRVLSFIKNKNLDMLCEIFFVELALCNLLYAVCFAVLILHNMLHEIGFVRFAQMRFALCKFILEISFEKCMY